MERRKKTIIITILVLIGILLLFLFLGGKRKQIEQGAQPKNSSGTATASPAPAVPKILPRTQEEQKTAQTENQMLAIARTFAERYGSFSNQSKFTNLLDLATVSTEALNHELASLYKAQQKESAKEYFGVTTRVVSLRVTAMDPTHGSVVLNTQREEARGTPQNTRVYYQNLQLKIVKLGNDWKVDGVQWE